jgi:hypothetical protein
MTQFLRKSSRQLCELAEQQKGYFTTKQAKAAGFAENTHPFMFKPGTGYENIAASIGWPSFRRRTGLTAPSAPRSIGWKLRPQSLMHRKEQISPEGARPATISDRVPPEWRM